MPRDRRIRSGAGVGALDAPLFRKQLLNWFARGHRDLPWRRTRDPYRIWLSEIMLQQTRAAAAIPYYEKFLARFPTVETLAAAPESEVLAAWAGLGYYSRARNLRKAAIAISEAGGFPRDFEKIRALPGVGPYTAAAVASIAFNLPHAVLDGNVMRVIARLFADPGDTASPTTRRRFQEIADTLLEARHPGEFNQAMMELGATVCLPRDPLCLTCPASDLCEAHQTAAQSQFPIKKPKPAAIGETLELVIIRSGDRVLMRQRPSDSSRMAGFWELPHLSELRPGSQTQPIGEFRHTIVNHRYSIKIYAAQPPKRSTLQWLLPTNTSLPITTITRKALALRNSIAQG
jgi:A/G-specific adenine glycosylase